MPSYTTSNPNPHNGAFKDLPNECLQAIVSFLCASDAANLRLVSRQWTDNAAVGLFNVTCNNSAMLASRENPRTFHYPPSQPPQIRSGVLSIRPHRDDMTRMKNIANTPAMAKLIKEVVIYTGDCSLNELTMRVREEDRELETIFNLFLSQTSRQFKKHCDFAKLSRAFSKLENVKHLSVLSKDLPLSPAGERLEELWYEIVSPSNERSSFSDELQCRLLASIRYRNILAAAAHFKGPLQSLHLDAMPIAVLRPFDATNHALQECRVPRRKVAKEGVICMEKTFSRVEDLLIGVVLDLENDEQYLKPLRQFLEYMPNLRSLEMTWERGNPADDPLSDDWYAFLQGMPWKDLNRLRLQNISTTHDAMMVLLQEYSKSLTHLSLRQCLFGFFDSNDQNQWKLSYHNRKARNMLTFCREGLSLKKLEYSIDRSEREIYDEEWKPTPGNGPVTSDWAKIYDIPPSEAKLIEHYVLGGCEWPMLEEDTADAGGDVVWHQRPEWSLNRAVQQTYAHIDSVYDRLLEQEMDPSLVFCPEQIIKIQNRKIAHLQDMN